MKSTEIVNSWDETKRVFGKQIKAWMQLHRICAAGRSGASVTELVKKGRVPSQDSLKRWEEAGLIVRHEEGVRGRDGWTVRWVATDKARRLLRVKPEVEAQAEVVA
jgi:hypothetical protein